MAERRCLIVGGCGYIGARIAEALATEGPILVTRRSLSPVREAWLQAAGIASVHFDSATDSRLPVSGDFDVVVSLAMPGAAEAARDPQAGVKARKSAQACLDLFNAGRAGRLLHFSSFHVYGGPGRGHYCEDDVPTPTHAYGQIHLDCERIMLAQPGVVVVRPSNMVAAPAHADLGDQAKLMFLDLCRQAASGALQLLNDGASYRDFLPIDDVLAALRILFECSLDGHRLFNLAQGRAQRLDEIAQMIQRAAAHPVAVSFGTGVDAFRAPFSVSIEHMLGLGWQPQALLSEEASRIIRFFS